MQGEVEPLLAPSTSRDTGEEKWMQDNARRSWLCSRVMRKAGVLIIFFSVVVALGALVIFSPELLEHGSSIIEPHHKPAGHIASHTLHMAHKNLARKHQETSAPSTLHGTGGFFTAEASSAALIDKSASACTDFYQHACGAFTMQPLPSDHDQWFYTFDGIKSRVAHRMRSILSSPSAGATGRLFRSCIDEEAIERAGTAPLTQLMIASQMSNEAAGRSAAAVLVHTVASLHRMNGKAFFFWNVGADADSLTQVMYMEQGGLTLPSHTYYINTDAESKAKTRALHTLVSRVFALLGHSADESEQAAAGVLEAETEIARLFLSHAAERAANSLPPLSFQEVSKGMATAGPDSFDWLLFFRLLGVQERLLSSDLKVVRVLDVSFYQGLCSLLSSKPTSYWNYYLKWNFLDPLIGHLGREFQQADLVFRKALYGVVKDPPRWRTCLHTLNSFIPAAVGAVYKDAVFQESSLVARDARALLHMLRARFKKLIGDARWMSPSSRTVAQKKLALMNFEVGGPAHTPPLPFSVQEGGEWFNNSVHIATSLVAQQVKKLATVRGRADWGGQLGPMSVNAFYSVHQNSLFLPAAMLLPPFFPSSSSSSSSSSSTTSPAGGKGLDPRDFGSIGALLGHEMTHGFDNVGRLFGPDLVIKSWWDGKTKAQYERRAQCVANYYHSYTEAGAAVDGNTTLGEDIADKGGLHLAYEAMLTYLRQHAHYANGGSELEDAKRSFFEAWAQTWCHIGTVKMKRDALLTDPHAPSRVRVNAALSQFAPFRDTFRCPTGAPMAPPIEPTCSLW